MVSSDFTPPGKQEMTSLLSAYWDICDAIDPSDKRRPSLIGSTLVLVGPCTNIHIVRLRKLRPSPPLSPPPVRGPPLLFLRVTITAHGTSVLTTDALKQLPKRTPTAFRYRRRA